MTDFQAPPSPEPSPWHTYPVDSVAATLKTSRAFGLSHDDVGHRLEASGPNVPQPPKHEPWWEEIVESLTEPLVLLLIAVGVLYALLGEIGDAITIFVVIVLVAAIEVTNESRAKRAIAALRTLAAPTATVVRDGRTTSVPTADIVPGDLVLLEPGDRVPADLRLTETTALRIDESALTGESVPALKRADIELPSEAEIGDRLNIAWAGTLVTAGKGAGIAVETGRATQAARIGALAASAREPRTPLQLQMRRLAGLLLWVAVGVSAIVPLVGIFVAGRPWREMLLTGLTLAFATIPEELPILITIVLGIGAFGLARRGAIVKRLRAAEALGSVSVLATDKTGTLTENKMRVAEVVANGQPVAPDAARAASFLHVLEVGVLANDARAQGGRFAGDPTETALLEAAHDAGLEVDVVRGRIRIVEEYPFDDARKRMSVVYERDGVTQVALKGAPESVLAACTALVTEGGTVPLNDDRRAEIQRQVDAMAERGLRTLAFAERVLDAPAEGVDVVERDLTLVGLAGLEDPPRPEVAPALAELRAAGVRVLMLTGDHPATAQAIARRVGIDADRVVRGRELDALDDAALGDKAATVGVFARIAPEHKIRIVRALQARGETVAVTGDGVNDAPALREAAIGVAMGKSGTGAAREAADLVLTDDNAATVVAAVRAGRLLYENLRKAVRYYLAAKVALITSSFGAVLLGLPVPFLPVQIIVLELFMDLGASTTFVAEPAEADVMARPPRNPHHPFLDRAMGLGILAGGLTLAAAVLGAYVWAGRAGLGDGAQTVAFATWMVGHVALAAHMRSERQPLLARNPFANRVYWIWAAAAAGLLVVGTVVPFVQDRLHLAAVPGTAWAVAVVVGVAAPVWWDVVKLVRWRIHHRAKH